MKLLQNYSITNHLNWIYKSRGNDSFLEGMKVKFNDLEDKQYSHIWEELNRYYKQLLVENGFSDNLFAIYKKS